MDRSRIRYNAKARRSGATQKKKKRNNLETKPNIDFDVDAPAHPDPNVTIHTPRTKEQRANDKKERLRQEVLDLCIDSLVLTLRRLTLQLMATSNSKMTSKRKKRLDKYIVREYFQYWMYLLISPTGEKAQKGRTSGYTPETFVGHSTTAVLQISDVQ